MKASCAAAKVEAKAKYDKALADLASEHNANLSGLSDAKEKKEENYIYKNRQFDAKVTYQTELQQIKDRQHEAFAYKYHLIDMLRMGKFTFAEKQAQKRENYAYTFNTRDFLLRNGLYIVICMVFIALCIVAPVVKGTHLLTYQNVLNILQQASPRMFYALGVAGLILLTGTDLSIGRMVGMGMTAATIIMHQGINTGTVFGVAFDFTSMPIIARALLALVVCVCLTTLFTTIAGFFTARFKMHPFISTMANMLIIFGLVTYATKGVSFGAIEPTIPTIFIPKANGFPTIILWAVAAIAIIWFIWNKTTFGKNLYAVGGNPEAASVSGISVFRVTLGAFVLAGILYGFGDWLECMRMVGSGSAAYGQGWDLGRHGWRADLHRADLLAHHPGHRHQPAVRVLRRDHPHRRHARLPQVRPEEVVPLGSRPQGSRAGATPLVTRVVCQRPCPGTCQHSCVRHHMKGETMKKVLVCCTLSITSGLLVEKIRAIIADRGLDLEIEAVPIGSAIEQIGTADLIMLAPMVDYAMSPLVEGGAKRVAIIMPDDYRNYRAEAILDQAVAALDD